MTNNDQRQTTTNDKQQPMTNNNQQQTTTNDKQRPTTKKTKKNTNNHLDGPQSRNNPVSASAMLTGKFLQIRKVFATSSLLAEEFPDTLQHKISR